MAGNPYPPNPNFPIPFTSQVPFPTSNSLTLQLYLVTPYALRDANPHDYTTDGGTIASPGPFLLIPLGDALGQYNRPTRTYGIWVGNRTDKSITVTPIENVVPDQSQPDISFPGSTAITVAAGDADEGLFPWDYYAVEYLAVSVQAPVAPTKGALSVVVFGYH